MNQMVPYTLFFLIYLVYAFVILRLARIYMNKRNTDPTFETPMYFRVFSIVWKFALCFFCAYFLKNEVH